ncbi:YdcF family protein [Helcococcus bovis]|uniref:YdcF family protein n=1 Tax=Helcococcus bovis TaxID=3153252 RepID=UPI0038B6E619
MEFSLAITLFIFLILVITVFKERRNIISGIIFSIFLISSGITVLLGLEKYDLLFNSPVRIFVFTLIGLFSLFVLLIPIFLVIALIYNGIKILQKEGFSLNNLLSLSLGLYILLISTVGNILIYKFNIPAIFKHLIILSNMYFSYISLIAISYTISGFLNFANVKRKNLDYIIVLGSGLINDKVTPLLASRINKGIKIFKKNPNSKIIMSGGQGEDENIAEGEAMKQYALNLGISEKDIIVEDKSTTTRENLIFSKELMKENPKIAVVTNYYHLFRALIIAKQEKIKCIGYGAKTKLYFTINAFIREIIAFLVMYKNIHFVSVAMITLVYIFINYLLK